MKNLLKKLVFGDRPITEYSTITIKDGPKETVWLESGRLLIDISKTHWLLCLSPIVFGVWFVKQDEARMLAGSKKIRILFCDAGAANSSIEPFAIADLEYYQIIEAKEGTLLLLRYIRSSIHHVSFWESRLIYLRYYKKPGLSFQKLKSYVVAYSYPRKVNLVSFRENEYYNIFPMDLLGTIPGPQYHVFGLRHTNVALSRMIKTGNVVVSEVSCEFKNIIYQLGKHHASAPPALEALPFKVIRTENLGFFVPEWIESYKEIKIVKTMDLGSHMLLWGEWTKSIELRTPADKLFHIHFLHYLRQRKMKMDYELV